MPLPTDPDQAWPPPALRPALERMAEWRAWWAGDPDALAAYYGTSGPGGQGGAFSRYQYAGGAVGYLARKWWGRPPAAGEPHAKLHVPLGGDICRTSARLLFGEPFSVGHEDGAVEEWLGALLDEHAQARLLAAAEVQAAMGGLYLRPVADPAVSDRAWLDYVSPDAVLPEWSWGRLKAATVWRVIERDQDDKRVLRHLERHEPGRILHGLYEGTGDTLGRAIPLTEHPATQGFAQLLAEHGDPDGALPTGWHRLTISYVPNMLPSPRWGHNPLLAPMGRSDLDGIEGVLDALDETYSALQRDVRLGKGRIIVGDAMLDDQGPGQGATLDTDREAFAVVPGAMPKDVPLTVSQFDVRVEQWRATAHEYMTVALRRAGYALITLGEVEGGTALTATEVKAKGQLSFVTQGHKRGYWTPVLEREALPALYAVDRAAFPGRESAPPMPDFDVAPVSVEWPDSIAEDLSSLAGTVKVLKEAEAASTFRRVKIVNPDWTDPEVKEEVARILDERASSVTVAPFDDGLDDQPGEVEDLRDGPPDDEQDDDGTEGEVAA